MSGKAARAAAARWAGIVLGDSTVAHQEPAMDEPIACPQCGAPAQITERFWLDEEYLTAVLDP